MFGHDPELSFDVLVAGADVAAVTMPVLDRPSERAVQKSSGSTEGICGKPG